ncbi:MAG: MFS transporter [Candidatus Omnitrophica bacterium]|nr:MFS transporter [Candidatus Omnitrophota bacterium]
MIKQNLKPWLLILAWGLYDLANQFFAINVVSLYFVRWLTIERNIAEIFYSIAFGISTFLVAISAPLLGTISDMAERRRPFLVSLTLLSIFFTLVLGIFKSVFLALLFFVLANFGCQLAIVFYNAQLSDIAPQNKVGLVSGLGRMLGYSGAILAVYLVKPIVLKSGYQATFLPTGLLFLVFSLPCMLFIKDKSDKKSINLTHFLRKEELSKIFKNIRIIFSNTQKFSGLSDFLKASFFGLCAINVVILFMSVYATRAFGLSEVQIINLIMFSTVFAILGSIFSGFLSDYFGSAWVLSVIFGLWGICFLLGALVRNIFFYWLIGALVGLALGSTWVVSRALVIKLVSGDKIAEVFGIFNLVAYLSSIVGSLFWGLLLLFLSPLGEVGYRIALLSLNLFLVFALIFLLRIPKNMRLIILK